MAALPTTYSHNLKIIHHGSKHKNVLVKLRKKFSIAGTPTKRYDRHDRRKFSNAGTLLDGPNSMELNRTS